MNNATFSPNLLWIAAAGLAALTAGTIVRLSRLHRVTREVARARLGSMATWWGVAITVMLTALVGRFAAAALFAVVSVLAFHEFLRLARIGAESRRGIVLAYLLVLVNYGLIYMGWYSVFAVFVPLSAVALIGVRIVLSGRMQGFLREAALLSWGLLLIAYCLSHAVLLFCLPSASNPVAGAAGWFLYLVILTESNDITQALIGRRFGKRRIAPRVSPNKTWEGFLGGVTCTTVLAVLLAPWLTPLASKEIGLPYIWAGVAGVLISVAGYFGDLTVSALKRDAGVKDSGTLLPGQGGVLDRVDSLTLSGPAFYYFVVLVTT